VQNFKDKENSAVKSINVLINVPISDELVQRIISVSPQLAVRKGVEFAFAERKGDFSRKAEYDALLAEAEVIYGDFPTRDFMVRNPKLKWVHTITAGVDSFLADTKFRQSPIKLTNSSGVAAVSMAEFVIQFMLMFAKQALPCLELKQKKQWKNIATSKQIVILTEDLHSKTVGIVGLGEVGREVAKLAKGFGMKVLAIRRSAKRVSRTKYVDVLLPPGQLPKLLSESDFVVLSLALTPETMNFIGEKELRMMKPAAYLINIARGGVLDENALIKALEEKRIAGAGLDVFAREPLPVESKLWDLPNVIMSPHISAGTEDYEARATERFCNNLILYMDGKRLHNQVNKKRGY
jgi:D-2-hydroxyacid dehydrogenase (NADP+)